MNLSTFPAPRARLLSCVALLAASLLASCGGGGGGDSGPTVEGPARTVTYNYPHLIVNKGSGTSVFTGVNATITPPLPTGAYATLEGQYDILGSQSQIYATLQGNVSSMIAINPALPVGRHTGTLRWRVCKDRSCSVVYDVRGAILPYTITVETGLTATMSVNGQVQNPNVMTMLHVGEQVTLTCNMPCAWELDAGVATPFDNVTTTSTTWTGLVARGGLAFNMTARSASMRDNTTYVNIFISSQ